MCIRDSHEGKDSVMLKGIDQNKDQTYFLCQLNVFDLDVYKRQV